MLHGSNGSDNCSDKLFGHQDYKQAHCGALLLRRSFPGIPLSLNCNYGAISWSNRLLMDPGAETYLGDQSYHGLPYCFIPALRMDMPMYNGALPEQRQKQASNSNHLERLLKDREKNIKNIQSRPRSCMYPTHFLLSCCLRDKKEQHHIGNKGRIFFISVSITAIHFIP